MKKMIKILKWFGIILFLIVVGFILFVQFNWDKKWDAPYPEIAASKDSTVIARGKYLVYGPAHCGTCHVPVNKLEAVEQGEMLPLQGGCEFPIPIGTFRANNLTPDLETGIGSLNDKEFGRILRYSVGKEGNFLLDLMPFQEMCDDDITAIISFLRTQDPIENKIEKTEYTFFGKSAMALGMLQPKGPKSTPPKSIKIDSTVEYGKYLATNVSNCIGCHTDRNIKTGEYVGAAFAGGMYFEPNEYSDGVAFVSPNLTPDIETGIMARWDEPTFINRFKANRIHKGSPMPWGSFSRINEIEIKAIYRFLKSLDPVKNKIEKTVIQPGESITKN